jgi:hypothetical protein
VVPVPVVDTDARRDKVAKNRAQEGTDPPSLVNSLSCPTIAKRPIEFQFVDRLLTECLGWERPYIEVENSDELGGKADYVLGRGPPRRC